MMIRDERRKVIVDTILKIVLEENANELPKPGKGASEKDIERHRIAEAARKADADEATNFITAVAGEVFAFLDDIKAIADSVGK